MFFFLFVSFFIFNEKEEVFSNLLELASAECADLPERVK